MKKTILSHFYNEEYLLPWWLNHHKKIFDDGILINYDSTDNSIEIIKEICPSWTIVNSKNKIFEPFAVDREIMEYESQVEGYKITLNTTEFLIGNYKNLKDNNYIIPCLAMVDPLSECNNIPTYDYSLIKQKYFGMNFNESSFRACRCMHNSLVNYTVGRHFYSANTSDMVILWYGWSPYTEQMLQRKLQIKNKMPIQIDQLGFQHRMDIEEMKKVYNDYQKISCDLTPIISKYFDFNN